MININKHHLLPSLDKRDLGDPALQNTQDSFALEHGHLRG